jgi:hypothetical protein
MNPPSPSRVRWTRACRTAAAALGATAIFLPVHAIVELLARHIHTVRSFPSDFVTGFQLFRLACALNALLVALLPRLLARAEFADRPSSPLTSRDRGAAAALYVLALLLAIPGLRESFQIDEWRTLEQYIRHGPLIILTRSIGDNHVLYSLLAWPFVKILGMTEVALRLPSLLLGPLAPALLYALLRRGHAPARAFIASLPLAVSPFLLAFSQEGRAYAALFPALLGMLLLQPEALAGSVRAWLGFIALGVAAVYLHLYASLAVAAIAGAAFLRPEAGTPGGRARNMTGVLLIASISLLLYSPILAKYFAYSTGVQARALPRGPFTLPLAEGFVLPLSGIWAIPFAVVFVMGARRSGRLSPDAVAFLATVLLQLAVIELSFSDRSTRLYTPAIVLAWPVIAEGLLRFPRSLYGALVLGAISLGADANYLRRGRFDYREAAHQIEQRRRPEDSVAVLFDSRPINVYLNQPVDVLSAKEFCARRPTWFTLIEGNRIPMPEVGELADRDYQEVFRLSCARGDLVGYRRKDAR